MSGVLCVRGVLICVRCAVCPRRVLIYVCRCPRVAVCLLCFAFRQLTVG